MVFGYDLKENLLRTHLSLFTVYLQYLTNLILQLKRNVVFFFNFTGNSYSFGTDVEVIHNKFCRKVLCVKKSTNLSSIYGELGRVPLSVIRKCDRIRYWLRILKLPQNSVVRLVYNMLKKKKKKTLTLILHTINIIGLIMSKNFSNHSDSITCG